MSHNNHRNITMKDRKNVGRLFHIRYYIVLVMAIFSYQGLSAQLAVKTNVLYDATLTPNIGIEVGVGPRSTFSVVYGLHPWSFKSDETIRKAKHWVLMPEYRWWLCSKFDGHFLGVHAMGGQFNASHVNLPIPGVFFGGENIAKGVRDKRYEAYYAGGGFTYGYQWVLSKNWNFEAEIGIGYNYVHYKKFDCDECGRKIGEGNTNYVGITKLGLSFIYLF